MSRTITALFDSRPDAEAARQRLASANIGADDIQIIDQSSTGYSTDSYSTHENRGFWASLKDMFLPDEDRHTFEEGVRRGGYLLVVQASDRDADEAERILDETNAVDIDQRSQQWRESGWSGYQATSGATTVGMSAGSGMVGTGDRATGQTVSEERIPLVEEQLQVGKRAVARGGVRVRSYVVEQPVHEEVNLREEHVSVERRAVDQPVSSAELAAGDSNLLRERNIEVTETAEEAVVAKEARVREEVVVRKDVEERTEQIDDTVRRTEVEIDDERGADRLAADTGRRKPTRTDRDDKLR